jgi:hypothetical protein
MLDSLCPASVSKYAYFVIRNTLLSSACNGNPQIQINREPEVQVNAQNIGVPGYMLQPIIGRKINRATNAPIGLLNDQPRMIISGTMRSVV